MKKIIYIIIGVITVIFICIGSMTIAKNDEKKETTEITTTEKKSAQEVKSVYDKLTIGTGLENVNKILGSPLYTESSTDHSGNSETIYTWGSSKNGELGAKLTVGTENNIVVEKSVSGLYVSYDKEKVVSSKVFGEIQMNKDLSKEKAIKKFGKPNAIAEYKNSNGENIQTLTWETNTTGPLGSYFVITFTNDIATSKNEVGLV
ncbi:DUF3862 domain-containing protein [Enterococcus hirae]|uniref:DUF3862 domain-containing protein n=1 Tax=Enterococcus hirae TaxID=1354 RepID=UPI002DBC2018|nr:DUF3862 domain-containing protein [Enterococcus hirae]MEB7518832.1 DUF3862 domain-containing protein [Enterococcus hirae]